MPEKASLILNSSEVSSFFEKMQGYDKKQHFFYSFFIMLGMSFFLSMGASLLFSALVGLLKEIWDHFYGTGFCWYDMTANGFGLLFALLVIYSISFL